MTVSADYLTLAEQRIAGVVAAKQCAAKEKNFELVLKACSAYHWQIQTVNGLSLIDVWPSTYKLRVLWPKSKRATHATPYASLDRMIGALQGELAKVINLPVQKLPKYRKQKSSHVANADLLRELQGLPPKEPERKINSGRRIEFHLVGDRIKLTLHLKSEVVEGIILDEEESNRLLEELDQIKRELYASAIGAP